MHNNSLPIKYKLMMTGQYRVGLWQGFCLHTSKLGSGKRVAQRKYKKPLILSDLSHDKSSNFWKT